MLGTTLCSFHSVNFLKIFTDDSEMPYTSLTLFFIFSHVSMTICRHILRPRFLAFTSLALAPLLCSNNGENSSFTHSHSRLELVFLYLPHVLFKIKQPTVGGAWFTQVCLTTRYIFSPPALYDTKIPPYNALMHVEYMCIWHIVVLCVYESMDIGIVFHF